MSDALSDSYRAERDRTDTKLSKATTEQLVQEISTRKGVTQEAVSSHEVSSINIYSKEMGSYLRQKLVDDKAIILVVKK
jgi:hypothetical protein